MKPMLACDWDPTKLRFPMLLQPKIDGVRGLNLDGTLRGRSLKTHRNSFVTKLYSGAHYRGLDGELCAAAETDPALCRLTSSALSRQEGEPFTLWHCFDLLTPGTINLSYHQRYSILQAFVKGLQDESHISREHLRIVPQVNVCSMDELEQYERIYLAAGYEGVILRDPNGKYKPGRCTVNENNLLRVKRFIDAEAVVINYIEGTKNDNVAQINELGKTFRSTHQENMVPNGQVGTIVARDLATGETINVSPGNMDQTTRRAEWLAQHLAVGKAFTYKCFPKGVKDKPRFPTWKCWRDSVDMSN